MSNRYYNNQKLLISSLWVVAGVALCAASFAGKLPSDVWRFDRCRNSADHKESEVPKQSGISAEDRYCSE